MPTIYIPNPNRPVRCVNQIEDVCKECECHLSTLFRICILMDPDPDLDPIASQFGDNVFFTPATKCNFSQMLMYDLGMYVFEHLTGHRFLLKVNLTRYFLS
jgi:hypothetical protein